MNFASDNWAGAAQEINQALSEQAEGFAVAYGDSDLDHAIERRLAELFERECDVYFVGTGTAANAIAVASVAKPGGVAFCHDEAHLVANEGGAPEFLSAGNRLAPVGGKDGKIDPTLLRTEISHYSTDFNHLGQGTMVSITQATEAGTVYSLPEIEAVASIARKAGLALHMDGARFANALVELDCSPAEMTWKQGVDMVSFGGTKNGCWCAEALIIFNPELAGQIRFIRKRMGHLFSKTRFISAQFEAYLKDDLWLKLASHANDIAKKLERVIVQSDKVQLAWPCQSNQVFMIAERGFGQSLLEQGAKFYPFPPPKAFEEVLEEEKQMYRLVTSFASSEADVESFARLLS